LILVIVRSLKKAEDYQIMRLILAFALSIVPLAASAPAVAQQRTLTIFGDDKCPADTISCLAFSERGLRTDYPACAAVPRQHKLGNPFASHAR